MKFAVSLLLSLCVSGALYAGPFTATITNKPVFKLGEEVIVEVTLTNNRNTVSSETIIKFTEHFCSIYTSEQTTNMIVTKKEIPYSAKFLLFSWVSNPTRKLLELSTITCKIKGRCKWSYMTYNHKYEAKFGV